ncbi:MAG TPA: hypothetical protein DEP72_05840 [Clostridiales bacterium]|nr:MAG: hypothetical protein A2Y18_06315 [Clostridiales bacterium GWD2_32_19]HCC07663.1 hypothetical protein [Clostridiales bacterium]
MAYTRRKEKTMNIVLGILIGTIITAGIIVFFVYSNKLADKKVVNAQPPVTKQTKVTGKVPVEEPVVLANKELKDDERIQDYSLIKLPANLKVGDYVDVRIKNMTSIDKIVLAKKEVLELNSGSVWFKINESERNLMNKAIVEVNDVKSVIYTTTYINPEKQPQPEIGYLR